MMKKQFNVGIIGVGFIGPAHMEGLRRLGFNVAAVAEAGQALADEAAERLFIPKAYGNWKDMLDDTEIDVVHIASPNFLHFEQAKAVLLAGKHVICEKPLAMDSKQSNELVKLAKEKGLVNAVNFNLRFYPLIQEARHMVRSGRLGDQIYIAQGCYLQDWLLLDTDWNWRLEPELGGELRAIADIGSHWIDMIT
ncbi:MAG: Gfo/Idh/MocA family oxidoreductase, partial [Anaerolineales bacterium]|nr:Gfo/Idh/MocA family oxidoreductase [Anaerolineales bacterium]